MVFKLTPEEKLIREKTRLAITHATESNWDDAAKINLELLAIVPNDVEASNRLGRAYIELGYLEEAIKAFKYSLTISPHNTIAGKNIARLSTLQSEKISTNLNTARTSTSTLFISDSGKSTKLTLHIGEIAGKLPHFAPGTPLILNLEGDGVSVSDSTEQKLGMLPPKLGFRLAGLIAGGNKYEAIFVSNQGEELSILVREVYQDPSQRKLISFPPQNHPNIGEEEPQTPPSTDALGDPLSEIPQALPLNSNDSLLDISEDELLLTAVDTEDLEESEDIDSSLSENDDLEDEIEESADAEIPDPLDEDDEPLEISSLDSEIEEELEDDEDDLD
ncbi:MAG: hypothetical protein CL776_05090 [Chloroflexi bacterium]|nr:hypothetical protein [Chloroflexota bacterium]|tara:strand:- start:354 stop:1352 length:999 start_codon:yes stop_codon:yes gene_type:complete